MEWMPHCLGNLSVLGPSGVVNEKLETIPSACPLPVPCIKTAAVYYVPLCFI
jgi:hypothetical protein